MLLLCFFFHIFGRLGNKVLYIPIHFRFPWLSSGWCFVDAVALGILHRQMIPCVIVFVLFMGQIHNITRTEIGDRCRRSIRRN